MSRQIRIPFIGPMVRAIAADAKTETRRLGDKPEIKPGDTLLVCEAAWYWCEERVWVFGKTETGRPKRTFAAVKAPGVVVYCADAEKPTTQLDSRPRHLWRWKPPRFMPAWAVRYRLRVDGVRREPLQAITEEAAQREGVQRFFERFPSIGRDQCITSGERALDGEYRASFAVLWDELHGDHAPWLANREVRVISFHREK